jgi:hypothetical protein
MRRVRDVICYVGMCVLLCCASCVAQQGVDSGRLKLLDHLAGDWVLQGTIDGKQTTHDVHAEWVLNHEYLRLYELSREKNAKGDAVYEAIVFLGWDAKAQQYTCLWLDSTSGNGLSAETIGRAKVTPPATSIPFIFTISGSESLHTTFTYDASTDTWRWVIDDEDKGKTDRFADVRLTRAK